MKTWDEKTKQHWITTMQEHQDAYRFTQSLWWCEDAQRGCFFGCAMKEPSRLALSMAIEEMHLPPWLIDEAEIMFQDLPITQARLFPVRLCEAIPCDADIDYIRAEVRTRRLEMPMGNLDTSELAEYLIERLEEAS